MNDKLKNLADRITKEGQERLVKDGLGCQVNLDNAVVRIKEGSKYTKVDVGTSGRYMVDKDGNIFGIKAYGQVHRGHYYGTLDTIDDFYWGNYRAQRKQTVKGGSYVA